MDYAESEWEFLQKDKIFTQVDENNINIPVQTVEIRRDDQYNIVLRLIFTYLDYNQENTLYNLKKFEFTYGNNDKIKIYCHYQKSERKTQNYVTYHIFTYLVDNVENVRTTYKEKVRKDWYLNAIPVNTFNDLFCQQTIYYEDKTKKRLTVDEDFPEDNSYKKLLLDQITINCHHTKFKRLTLQLVQQEFRPSWSNSLCVEYHNIPIEKEVERVEDILNFILGRYLVKVGTTYLDKKDKIVREIALPVTEGYNIKYFCNMPSKSIILPLIIKPYDVHEIRKKLSHIITEYVNLEYDLHHTMDLYNQSLISNPSIEIIVIDAALDSFADIMDFKGSGKIKIYTFVYSRGIATKKGRYITLGEVEDKIRDYRNNITHGKDIDNKQDLYMHNLAYRILYGRILLTYLDITKYYDLTTLTVRDIKEPIDKVEYYDRIKKLNTYTYSNSLTYYCELMKQ